VNPRPLTQRPFWLSFLITTTWINMSEVFRYFVLVKPTMQTELAMVPNVAPMNLLVFASWGVWDTVLTFMLMWMVWLCATRFHDTKKVVLIAGTAMWLSFFAL
jgi:hypothetical protein